MRELLQITRDAGLAKRRIMTCNREGYHGLRRRRSMNVVRCLLQHVRRVRGLSTRSTKRGNSSRNGRRNSTSTITRMDPRLYVVLNARDLNSESNRANAKTITRTRSRGRGKTKYTCYHGDPRTGPSSRSNNVSGRVRLLGSMARSR